MFIPDPDFYPSRISDPGSKNSNKRERWKKISCHTFLCSHKFHKIVNYFGFEVLKKKIWANFHRIIELFTKKIIKKLLNMVLGSGIRDPEKTYSGSRIQGSKSTRSRIRIRNTVANTVTSKHCKQYTNSGLIIWITWQDECGRGRDWAGWGWADPPASLPARPPQDLRYSTDQQG